MTTVPTKPEISQDQPSIPWKVLAPYGLAIVAQLPMLLLYCRSLWERPHYQPFGFAIIATVGLALMRWPFGHTLPFHRSLSSDILLVIGLGFAFLGMVFVEPWCAAFSVMLIITSLLARTLDKESLKSLWPCSLPLFVYLMLPNGMDVRLITKLQQYSAQYTSRLLDLVGLGHHMDGTLIRVPGVQDYGIEQACSGVQSFFTLLLVAVIFIVLSRRLSPPKIAGAVIALFLALLVYILRLTLFTTGFINELGLLVTCGLILFSFLGFRAAALILSAVFWAIFMNTLRILTIPLSEYLLQINLSEGIPHDILGYVVLALGILMLFSTDQFLFFMFGPVESSAEESGPLGRFIRNAWNTVLSGNNEEDDERGHNKRRRRGRRPISKGGRGLIWTCAGLMAVMGLWQLYDVQRSMAAKEGIEVRFFDDDPTIDFELADMPVAFGDWRRDPNGYQTEDRSRGSDLGQRSDTWRFQSPAIASIFSLDQPFPGWHELTTCYKNVGWKLVENGRSAKLPSEVLGTTPSSDEWGYVEAVFEKPTGEKAYLLFSHFDAFGDGVPTPREWGTLNSFMIRAQNRLSHRIRASLFQGEAYQTQVFLTSFNDFSDEVKQECQLRYLEIREHIRNRYREKKKAMQNGGSEIPVKE